MKKILFILPFFFVLAISLNAVAQTKEFAGPQNYERAEVINILSQETVDVGGSLQPFQKLTVRLRTGPDKGTETNLDHALSGGRFAAKRGDQLVVIKDTEGQYVSMEVYRLPSLIIAAFVLFAAVVTFAGKRGFYAFFGLLLSVLVLAKFIVPQIIAGKNPLLISFAGGFFIICVSLYMAHGFNHRTSLALASTTLTMILSIVFALAAVSFTKLFGLGSEEAFSLQFLSAQNVNFRGLMLGGMIIGALGVLDDITTAQTAAIYEIHRADEKLGFSQLMARGLSIGREHITSLVNTLFLAYAGASFPLLLLFTIYPRPLWVILNGETIAEEIVRTVVGSVALVLAVPISTMLAAYFFTRPSKNNQ